MSQSGRQNPENETAADHELVRAAQHALPAFEHLYRRYVNDVYRYCRRRMRSEPDAIDATSQVFTQALANISKCDPEAFRPWLFTIARNVVVDVWRKDRPNAELSDQFPATATVFDPEEQAVAADERRSLLEMLPLLTEDQRAVIELRLAGLSAVEIAKVLGKNRNAVDQAQFRAVQRLRVLLSTNQTAAEGTVIS